MPRRVGPPVLLLLCLALVPVPGVLSATSQSEPNDPSITATLDGAPMEPIEASHHYCHTRDYPIVRCFSTPEGLDADLGWPGADSSLDGLGALVGPDAPETTFYTVAYTGSSYSGTYIYIGVALSDLGAIGWGDVISSVKSVNCGYPIYYTGTGYTGNYLQVTCNAGVANLGTYNDSFNSVENG